MKYIKFLPFLLLASCAPTVTQAPQPPSFPWKETHINFVQPGQKWDVASPKGAHLTFTIPTNYTPQPNRDGDIEIDLDEGLMMFNAEDNMLLVGGVMDLSVGMCVVVNVGGHPQGILYGRYAAGSNLKRLAESRDPNGFEGVCTIRITGGSNVNFSFPSAQSKIKTQAQ